MFLKDQCYLKWGIKLDTLELRITRRKIKRTVKVISPPTAITICVPWRIWWFSLVPHLSLTLPFLFSPSLHTHTSHKIIYLYAQSGTLGQILFPFISFSCFLSNQSQQKQIQSTCHLRREGEKWLVPLRNKHPRSWGRSAAYWVLYRRQTLILHSYLSVIYTHKAPLGRQKYAPVWRPHLQQTGVAMPVNVTPAREPRLGSSTPGKVVQRRRTSEECS